MADKTKRRGRLTLAQRLAPIDRSIESHRKKLTAAFDRRARLISEAEADAKNRLEMVQSALGAADAEEGDA